ncbi:MAG: ABC transporter substrate-binding protein [Pseudomonadota bacterium]
MNTKASSCGYKSVTMGFSVVIIMLLLGGIPSHAEEVRGVTKDTVKIGHLIDMTGPTAGTVRFIPEAVRNYFQYINSEGGINGRQVKVIFEDDRYSIPAALAAFKKLVYRDKVFALIGAGSTGGTTSLLRHIAKEKIPMFNYPVSEIIYIPPKRYVFGQGLTSEDEVRTIYHYILNVLGDKTPKIAIVYPDVEFGKYGRDTARERSRKFGLKLYEEILSIGALDATSQVLSLKRVKPDYIILHGPPAFAGAVMRDARKFGLSVKLFMATYFAADDVTVRMVGKAAEKFIGTSNVCTWYDKSPGAAKMRDITQKLRPDVPDSQERRTS